MSCTRTCWCQDGQSSPCPQLCCLLLGHVPSPPLTRCKQELPFTCQPHSHVSSDWPTWPCSELIGAGCQVSTCSTNQRAASSPSVRLVVKRGDTWWFTSMKRQVWEWKADLWAGTEGLREAVRRDGERVGVAECVPGASFLSSSALTPPLPLLTLILTSTLGPRCPERQGGTHLSCASHRGP